jgi:hypothetical protein
MSEKPRPPAPPTATHPAVGPPDFLQRFMTNTLTEHDKLQMRLALTTERADDEDDLDLDVPKG